MRRLILPLLFACAAPTGAATFTVTNVFDSGAGSLRDAMTQANAASGNAQRIEFASALNGSVIELLSPLPTITKMGLEIDGPGISIEPIDPLNAHRLLVASSSVLTLTLRGLSLSRGLATGSGTGGGCLDGSAVDLGATLRLENTRFRSCLSAYTGFSRGGAVHWRGDSLVIQDSIFENNAAVALGTGALDQASGGAVYAAGVVNVARSRFSSQIVNGKFTYGGAIAALESLIIADSVFYDNAAVPEAISGADGAGGAVSVDCESCLLRIERSFFGDNRSKNGSAVFVRGNLVSPLMPVTLSNVSFSGNTVNAGESGGALFAVRSSVTGDHLSFQGNAGVAAHLHLPSSTLSALRNSVLGASVSPGCGGFVAQQSIGNIVTDTSCQAALPGAIRIDGLAAATVNVNDAMPVIAYPVGSPVIDAGDVASCLAVDTRNTPRPQDGDNNGQSRCDVGAYERLGNSIFANGFEG